MKSSGAIKREAYPTPSVTWLADTAIAENVSYSFLENSRAKNFIPFQSSIGNGQLSNFSFVRPAYAAGGGGVGGGGCAGKPSAFGIPFRAGESHEENNDQSQHEKNGIEQIRDSEGIIHRDTFSANNKLALQQMSVAVIPTSIAATSGLSTEVKSGVTTPTAKNTVPALSQILESRSNWDRVNTGVS